jgi:hypothetical protein
MMKKSTLLTMVIFMIAMLIYSCDKDEFSEEDAYKYEQDLKAMEAELAMEMEEARLEWLQDSLAYVRMKDSLERIGGIINYAVNVVSGGDAGFTKAGSKEAEWLHGTVTINQHGHRVTEEIGLDGIAVFEDLRIGLVTVNIQCPGYTTVDYEAVLNPDWTMEDVYDSDAVGAINKCCEDGYSNYNQQAIPLDDEYYGIKRNATTMVPVFPMEGQSMSTIKGQVTWETNLTNCAPETAQGVRIIGMIDTESDDFKAKYMRPTDGMLAYDTSCMDCLYGQIVNIIYGGVVARGTEEDSWASVTDNDGLYTLRVPSTATGLPIKLTVSEVAADQYLLVNTLYGEEVFGIQKVRAVFSTELAEVSPIPLVPPAYAVFEEPKGNPAEKPAVEATAKAVIGESGIDYVHIQDQGSCYTQAPEVIIKQKACGDCNQYNTSAKAVAHLTEGKVTEIEVRNPGTGYFNTAAATESITVDIVSKPELMGTKASLTPIVTYSLSDVTLDADITGFDAVPAVLFNADAGEGAVLEPVMKRYVDDIELVHMGEGYTAKPTVLLKGGNPEEAATVNDANVQMSTANPVHSITIKGGSDLEDEIFADPPTIVVESNDGNHEAKAVGQLEATGGAHEVNVINGGYGYSNDPALRPTVELTGDGFGAEAHAEVDADGKITAIVVDREGEGYTTMTVNITAPVEADGVQATAEAIIGKKIANIEITDNGSGFNDGNINTVMVEDYGDAWAAPADVDVMYSMKIESITPSTNGKGYQSAPEVEIIPTDGNGKNAIAEAKMKWLIDDIKVVAGGSGYLHNSDDANQRIVVEGYGALVDNANLSGDEVDITLGNGKLAIEIDDAGNYYEAPPHILLTHANDEAKNQNLFETAFEITAQVRNGEIIGFEITDPGVDLVYVESSQFTLSVKTECTNVEASAFAYANAGQITAINITNPGAGYRTTPVVEITPATQSDGNDNDDIFGQGWGAKAHAVMLDGRVAKIVIDNPGNGYVTSPTININVPEYSEQAKGAPIIAASGRITGVQFTPTTELPTLTAGMGYDPADPPSVTFYPSIPGMGKGAKGTCIVQGGEIVDVIMTDGGSGYLGRNYCHDIPVTYDPDDATDELNAGEDNKGVIIQFMPMYDDWYKSSQKELEGQDPPAPAPAVSGSGLKMQTEAGKAYIKDIYLGTGYRHM